MEVLRWLISRTPRPDDDVHIEDIAGWADVQIIVPADGDPGEPEATSPVASHDVIDLEPIFTIMEYTDVKGAESRRRITTLRIRFRSGHHVLLARCHERKAQRTFRLDRIGGFIDSDGEIIPPDQFFHDLLDVDLNRLLSLEHDVAPAPRSVASAYTRLRREISPALVILSAAARVDHFLHPEEVDRIMQYTETAAMNLRRSGDLDAMPSVEDFDRLGRLILRTRPTQDELGTALTTLARWPDARLAALGRALVAVITADGVIVPSEEEFADDLRRLLRLEGG